MKPLEVTTPSDTEVCVKRSFDAPASLVWRAFSEPALVKRWLTGPPGHSMPICEIDFREGGKWRYVWKMPEGEMVAYGTFRSIAEHRRIVHSETFAAWPDSESIVTTIFTETGGRTLVTMTMAYDSRQTRDIVLQTGITVGMEHSYTNLDELLQNVR